jgi:quercetin dioxygenase-like cupin family protein
MPAPGQIIEDPLTGTVLRFVATARSTGGAAVRMELEARPGWTAGPVHVHPRQTERIRVVGGSMRARVGGEERLCGKGDEVDVAPGTPHTVANAADAPLRLEVEFAPALRTDEMFEGMFGGGPRRRPPGVVPSVLRAWFESRGFADEIRYLWPRRALVAAAALAPVVGTLGRLSRRRR